MDYQPSASPMNYSSFKTRTLEQMLDNAAEGSAEQRAVQKELRRRAEHHPDTGTMELPLPPAENQDVNP